MAAELVCSDSLGSAYTSDEHALELTSRLMAAPGEQVRGCGVQGLQARPLRFAACSCPTVPCKCCPAPGRGHMPWEPSNFQHPQLPPLPLHRLCRLPSPITAAHASENVSMSSRCAGGRGSRSRNDARGWRH